MKKKIILFFTALFVAFAFLQIGVFAQTNYYSYIGGTNETNTNPYNDQRFEEASKCTIYDANSKTTVSATISTPYELHIWHFNANQGLNYCAYTRSSSNTLISVYDEKDRAFGKPKYVEIDKNDDGGFHSNNSKDSSLTFYWQPYYPMFYQNDDFYVVVRMFGNATGSYELNVGPADSELNRSAYPDLNYWVSDDNLDFKGNYDLDYFVDSIYYLNEYETLIAWWLANDNEKIKDFFTEAYPGELDDYLPEQFLDDYIADRIDGVGVVCNLINKFFAGDTTKIGNFQLSYVGAGFGFVSDMCDLILFVNSYSKDAFKNVLNSAVKWVPDGNAFHQKAIIAKYIAIKTHYSYSVGHPMIEAFTYEKDAQYLYGAKNYKGHWEAKPQFRSVNPYDKIEELCDVKTQNITDNGLYSFPLETAQFSEYYAFMKFKVNVDSDYTIFSTLTQNNPYVIRIYSDKNTVVATLDGKNTKKVKLSSKKTYIVVLESEKIYSSKSNISFFIQKVKTNC